jgi:hypothetical protein
MTFNKQPPKQLQTATLSTSGDATLTLSVQTGSGGETTLIVTALDGDGAWTADFGVDDDLQEADLIWRALANASQLRSRQLLINVQRGGTPPNMRWSVPRSSESVTHEVNTIGDGTSGTTVARLVYSGAGEPSCELLEVTSGLGSLVKIIILPKPSRPPGTEDVVR